MIESMPWRWELLSNEQKKEWKDEPSKESYYLVYRWKSQGKKKFLDLGCGCGRNTIFYAQNGFDTYALDKSEYAVKYTKEISKIHKLDINIQTGDMLNMPYENEFFDCILCRNVISHTDTEGIKVIIKKLYDILKYDGECFLTLGSKNSDLYKDPKNLKVDENTKRRMDPGVEYRVPHFYADMNIIPKLFEKFKIEYISQLQYFKQEKGKFLSRWNYLILIKKCKEER